MVPAHVANQMVILSLLLKRHFVSFSASHVSLLAQGLPQGSLLQRGPQACQCWFSLAAGTDRYGSARYWPSSPLDLCVANSRMLLLYGHHPVLHEVQQGRLDLSGEMGPETMPLKTRETFYRVVQW